MEVTPAVNCETFVLSVDLVPSVEDMQRAAEPGQLEQLYREAGLQMLAANVGPLRRARAAAQNYVELPVEDYRLYVEFLTQRVALQECTIPPPDNALTVLVGARKSNNFDRIDVLTHPSTGESLLLGYVTIGNTTRYFKLAHWGYNLTSITQLRKRRRFSRVVGRGIRSVLQWRPRFRFPRLLARGGRGPIFFGALTVLAAVPIWLLLLPISWWLFAAVLAVALSLCGYYTFEKTSYDSVPRHVVAAIIVLQAVGAVVMGGFRLHHWSTVDRTEEVLVCGQEEATIHTSAGDRTLEGGFYNGTYYPAGTEELAKSLVGQWVRLTEHGYSMGEGTGGPYVTGSETLRPGSCG